MDGKDEDDISKFKLLRCMEWLQKQNNEDSKKLAMQNKNDIQFIIQNNAQRKKFLLAAADDDQSVPLGVDEPQLEPVAVPLRKLRTHCLRFECDWQNCRVFFADYEEFQLHVTQHIQDLHVIQKEDGEAEYVCLWDICGHKTCDFKEIVRHVNYHAYHARLMATGFNGRATLNLERCYRDSKKRNSLPLLKADHCCRWTDCEQTFNSMQKFLDHVKSHLLSADDHICTWAGCGKKLKDNERLSSHVRTHTCERIIACYHCGQHFANNRKLCDHLRRQNVVPCETLACQMCGVYCATEYLLREHERQHVSYHACTLCDMSATTPAKLAIHVRARHLPPEEARPFKCTHCGHRVMTSRDLRKHLNMHAKKRKREEDSSDANNSDDENDMRKKVKEVRKYCCHICPEKSAKIFKTGTNLTTHLVKVHGAQWPFGHTRFRYQRCKDGIYRLITSRYEVIEVSKKILDGYSGPKRTLTNSHEFNVKKVAPATEHSPVRFEVTLKSEENEKKLKEDVCRDQKVEITMCDVDEEGNVISSEVISDVLYNI